MPLIKSWISPKAQKGRPSEISGLGLFALEPIKKDETVAAKLGHLVDRNMLEEKANIINEAFGQIADDMFLAPLELAEYEGTMTFINHSCNANVGWGGNILFVAMRDIGQGEEMTVDYATQWSDSSLKIEPCNCGSKACRGRVTGDDWKNPEIQKKYAGYFSWYLQKKIDKLNGQTEL